LANGYITNYSNQINWKNYSQNTFTYISTFRKDTINSPYIKFILYTPTGITEIYKNHKLFIILENEDVIELHNLDYVQARTNGQTRIIIPQYSISNGQITQILSTKVLLLSFETSMGFLDIAFNPYSYDTRINELLKAVQ